LLARRHSRGLLSYARRWISNYLRRLAWQCDPRSDPHQIVTLDWLERSRRVRRPWRSILRRDPCAYCGAPAQTVDHIVAKARAGADRWDNLTGACVRCNRAKTTRALLMFLAMSRPHGWRPALTQKSATTTRAQRREIYRRIGISTIGEQVASKLVH
jgi:5-methylcytosine-specific restriction endonuclease McrA